MTRTAGGFGFGGIMPDEEKGWWALAEPMAWPPPDIETRRRCYCCGWPVQPGDGICNSCYRRMMADAEAAANAERQLKLGE